MKRGLLLFVVVSILVILLASSVSANPISNLFGKISGNIIYGCNDEYLCSDDGDCVDGYACNLGNNCCEIYCQPNWEEGTWSACAGGIQTRTDTDLNGCQPARISRQYCSTSTGVFDSCDSTSILCNQQKSGHEFCFLNAPYKCVLDSTRNCLNAVAKNTPSACSSGSSCQENTAAGTASCTSTTQSTVGACSTNGCSAENAKRCSSDATSLPQICTKDTTNNCLKWVSQNACSSGQTCQTSTGTCGTAATTGNSGLIISSSPSGTLIAGTTSTTVSVTTSETSQCRYSTSSGKTFETMTNTLNTVSFDGKYHSISPVAVSSGTPYIYYIACKAQYSSKSDSLTISFSVASSSCTSEWECEEWTSCTNNQQTRTCTDKKTCGTSIGKPETTRVCISTTQPACQWDYQSISSAFCSEDGKKKITATEKNAPCTGEPDPTKCSAVGGTSGWKKNSGSIGWSCDFGTCKEWGAEGTFCGWTLCHPEPGKTDPNCKTPDGTLIINDVNQCLCNKGKGCFGTQGDWRNYACDHFQPTRLMRVGIANKDIQMSLLGLENSCPEIQNEAGTTIANYLMGYSFFNFPLGSIAGGGAPSGWLERYNFVKTLTSNQKAIVFRTALQSCNNQCTGILTDVGLIGNGNTDSSSWRQWRLDQALGSCFVLGIGSASVSGNGDILVGGNKVGSAFDPTLDLTPGGDFSKKCINLLKGNTECTQTNSAAVCGNTKMCHQGMCCTPSTTAPACPTYINWDISCSSSGKQKRVCGNCNALKVEENQCPQLNLSGFRSIPTTCKLSTQSFGIFANRNSECRYGTSDTSFESMAKMNRESPQRTDLADFRVSEVPVKEGVNTFYIKCKTTDGPSVSEAKATVTINNPSNVCSSGGPGSSGNGTGSGSGSGNGTGGGNASNGTGGGNRTGSGSGKSGTVTDKNTDVAYSLAVISSRPLSSPSLPSGTKQASLSVITNKAATCRYSKSPTSAYEIMTLFSVNGGTTHVQRVPVSSGESYKYYVLCRTLGGEKTEKYTVSFSVKEATERSSSGRSSSATSSSSSRSSSRQTSSVGSDSTTASSGDKIYGTPVKRNFFQKIADFFRNLFS